jgi:hypothetical protein
LNIAVVSSTSNVHELLSLRNLLSLPPHAAADAENTRAMIAAAANEIPAGTYPFKEEPVPAKKKLRNILIWVSLCIVIVVPAVVG